MSALRRLKIAAWCEGVIDAEPRGGWCELKSALVRHSKGASALRHFGPNSRPRGADELTFNMCRSGQLHCLDEGAARDQILISQIAEAWRKLRARDAGWPYDPFVAHDTASHFLDERYVR